MFIIQFPLAECSLYAHSKMTMDKPGRVASWAHWRGPVPTGWGGEEGRLGFCSVAQHSVHFSFMWIIGKKTFLGAGSGKTGWELFLSAQPYGGLQVGAESSEQQSGRAHTGQ